MNDLYKTLEGFEVSLHKQNTRSDRSALLSLLHPEFKEIGYSGITYNLASILDTLTTKKNMDTPIKIWSQEFEFIELAPNIVQVLYLSANEIDGALKRHAKRTSIWVKESEGWKMQFHQATPIPPFEKIYA